MKKITTNKTKTVLMAITIMSIALLTQGCWINAGKLIIVSTRNMDSHADYILLSKTVAGKAKVKKGEALQAAIDDAVGQYSTGEFMKNVSISN